MKTKTANGWTVAKILERIDEKYIGRSMDVTGSSCVYLNDIGHRCAIGLFIPDEHPGQKYGGSVAYLLKEDKHPDLWEHMPFKEIDYLSHFQNLHDDNRDFKNANLPDQKQMLKNWILEHVEDA